MRNWVNKKKPLALFGLILVESGKSFLAHEGFQSAATLAYYGFFALIPMLLLVVIILGYLSGSSEAVLTNITGVVERLVPEFSDVILNEIHLLARQKAWGAFSIIVLLWVVTPFTHAVRASFSRIFRANRRANVIKSRGLSVATGIALVCFLVVLVLGRTLVGTVLGHVSLHATWPLGIFIAKTLVSLIASSLFVAFFYLLFTPVKIKAAELLTGAVLTGALLYAIRPAFSFLIRFRPNYGLAFGSLKAVFVVTVWVYYVFVAVLWGAEVIASLRRREALLLRRLFLSPAETLSGEDGLLAPFVKKYEPGETILEEGTRGDEMFYILAGAAAMLRGGATVRTLASGDYFGEMSMLLDEPRTASVKALEPGTKVVVISRHNFDAILAENPVIVRKLLTEMARRLKETTVWGTRRDSD